MNILCAKGFVDATPYIHLCFNYIFKKQTFQQKGVEKAVFFPTLEVLGFPTAKLYEGSIITARGVSSSIDLGLYLCEKLANYEVKEKIKEQMDYKN